MLYKVEECSKEVVLNKALIGGYPEVSSKTPQARKIWFENYITRLLERDLKDIGHFEKGDALRKILLLLSNISSRTISRQELSKALMLHSATIDRYLGALKTMYLIDEVPAWSNKIMPRLVKAPNFYMSDSGLMSALQGHYDLDSLMRWVNYVGKPGSDFVGNLVD